MTSELCRRIGCGYFGKFSGKAVCREKHPKKYIKHLDQCPQGYEKYAIVTQKQASAPM